MCAAGTGGNLQIFLPIRFCSTQLWIQDNQDPEIKQKVLETLSEYVFPLFDPEETGNLEGKRNLSLFLTGTQEIQIYHKY